MNNLESLPIEECELSSLEELKDSKSAEYWRWVFGADGKGARAMCSRDVNGAIAGYVVALRVPALVNGEPAELLHAIEARIADSAELGSKAQDELVHLAEHFARTFGGNPPDSAPLIYGLPSPAFWSVAKEQLSAKVMRTQVPLSCSATTLQLPDVASVSIEVAKQFPEEVAQLKLQAAAQSEVVCRPTAASLNARFFDVPTCAELESRFQVALARKAGELVGYAVIAPGRTPGDARITQVWDWCVPGDQEAAISLLDWIRTEALQSANNVIRFTLPDTRPDWISLQELGFRVEPSSLVLTVRHFPRQMTMRWLYHNWNYSLSDWKLNSAEGGQAE